MSTQFLTDERMLVASILVFVAMLTIASILLAWRDWDVVWVDAFLVIQAVLIYYYYQVWLLPDAGPRTFPLILLLARPATIAFWVLVVTYSLVRLRLKYKARHGQF